MGKHRALLASDMDGTVIPLEETPKREEEVTAFRKAVEGAGGLTLAYVTGRDLPLALKGIRQHGLPKPDILVADVGTSVYHSTSSGFEKDMKYVKLMEEARGGLDVREVHQELTGVPHLLLQADDRQTEAKLSYHLAPEADHLKIMDSVQEVLDDIGGTVQAVYSVGAPSGIGLLDLLPAGVAKDYAVRYLHDHTGVDQDQLISAGDSGNDLAAMLTGFKAIVVGNAPPELKRELTVRGEAMGFTDRIYFAEDCYAAGVLEGSRHFGIL
ncbi:MAG: HAD family hydrolase [Longimicrobiales bacterium]|nr:HAD family hydrolase [Longimicrobiales bacterium]